MTTAIELLRNPRLVADDLDHCFGSGQDACLQWDTAETNDALKLGLKLNDAAFSGNFILVNKDHLSKDTGLGVTADPRLVVWSGDDPAAGGANEYISLMHDRTDAVIETGAGNLTLNPAGEVIVQADTRPLTVQTTENGTSVQAGIIESTKGAGGALDDDEWYISYRLKDTGSAQREFARMTVAAEDVGGAGQHDGRIVWSLARQGNLGEILRLESHVTAESRVDITLQGSLNLRYTDAAFAFQKATTISTTAGDLTINPAGRVVLGAHDQEFGEIADPAAPAANSARFYAKDNGSGKTQLVVRFSTGAVQVLATEP